MEHALAPGTELRSSTNTYIIRSVLGSGGFGITYKATFNGYLNGLPIQAVVAIKEHFISADCERNESTRSVSYSAPARSRVEGSRKDFVGEARRLQSVGRGHRNIVQVSEVFDANNTSYYVMEYLEGESLSDYVRSHGPLSESETLSIMRPIIEAVGYLHQNRITHLDIKPANIMLAKDHNGDVRPVLIDFGLSKHYNEDGSATSTINTQGFSDGYAPVEQYIGLSTFSPASDVYSLAATIMYCLTGRSLPKSIELTPQVVEASIPKGISSNLHKTLSAALQMLAPQRPADGNALSAMLGGANNSAKPEPTPKVDKTERVIDPGFPNTEKTEFYPGAAPSGNGQSYTPPTQNEPAEKNPYDPQPPTKRSFMSRYGVYIFAGIIIVLIIGVTIAIKGKGSETEQDTGYSPKTTEYAESEYFTDESDDDYNSAYDFVPGSLDSDYDGCEVAYQGYFDDYLYCNGIYEPDSLRKCLDVNLDSDCYFNRYHFSINLNYCPYEVGTIIVLSDGWRVLKFYITDDWMLGVSTNNGRYFYSTNINVLQNEWNSIEAEYYYGQLSLNGYICKNVIVDMENGDNFLSSIDFSCGLCFNGLFSNILVFSYYNEK